MKKLWPFFKGYRLECFLAPFFKLLEAIFELFVPLVVASIIDSGISGGKISYTVYRILLMVLLGIIGFISAVTAQYFSAKAATGFATTLREAAFTKTQELSFTDIDRTGVSTIIQRLTGDVNQLQTGVNLFLRLFMRSPFIVFGAMIMAFMLDPVISRIFVLMIALLFVTVFAIMLFSIPLYKTVQKHTETLLGHTRENLAGVRVLRAFCKEKAEIEAYEQENCLLVSFQKFVGRISALMNPLTLVLVNGAIVLLLRTGAMRIDAGLMTQGMLIALYNYLSQILVELIKFADLIITLTKSVASAGRITKLLDLPTRQRDGIPFITPSAGVPAVQFADVSFTYAGAGEATLRHISFSVNQGETVGIIGGTGSGKSTLMMLLTRFYQPTAGKILLHGADIVTYAEKALRRHVAIVLQKSVLFRGTLRENMQWEKTDATDEEIFSALQTAQADDIVRAQPAGLDATVQQNGRNFSGGQRQRLAIARALVKGSEILILDDSTSALDYATEARLRTALQQTTRQKTVFVVSQRCSAVMHADKILVLDGGRLVGNGTHQTLLETCAVYREIYTSQSGKGMTAHA